MKRFYPIFLAAMLALTACTPAAPSASAVPAPAIPSTSGHLSVAPIDPIGGEISEGSHSSEVGEPMAQPDAPLMVADAAMYRGTLTTVEETPEGKKLLLQQAEGTNFGSEEHRFLLTPDTRMSFSEEQLVIGAYLEIYYGVPMGQAPDHTKDSHAIAINRYADAATVVFNGVLKTVEKEQDGKGRLVLEQLVTKQETVFHFDEATQFYLTFDQLKAGDTLNLLHAGMLTMSIPPQGAALEVRPYASAS